MTTQAQLDELFSAFCEETGVVMDSEENRHDFAVRGRLHDDPGSDVHDFNESP